MAESQAPEFTRMLGAELVQAEGGCAALELELAPFHMSRAGRVHGGVIFTLLDTALGRAIISGLPAGRGCTTVECKVNYFRPVQAGSLRAVGRVVNLSRRTGYAEGEVKDSEGRLIARASGTFMLTDAVEQSDRERI